MTTILLITPVLRTKNLLEIGKNIVERFKSAKELVPFWILAFDKYHADISDESISVIRNFCNDNSLQHHIYFEGVDLTDLNTSINRLREDIGMVFQSFNLFNNLSVLDSCTLAKDK